MHTQFLEEHLNTNVFTVFALITMFLMQGMIPGYIVVTQLLRIGDTIAALIIPMLLSPFNIILMRTFFKRTIPEAILNQLRSMGQVKHGFSSKSVYHCLFQGLRPSVLHRFRVLE